MKIKEEIDRLQESLEEEVVASVNLPVKEKEDSPKAIAIKGVKGYFPTFRRPGRLLIPVGDIEMHYISAYKTTDLHDKVALGVMKVISDMYNADTAKEVRASQGVITAEDMEQYTEITFDMEQFSTMVNDKHESRLQLTTAERLMELASVTLYVVRAAPLDVMPLQWYRKFTVKKGQAAMLINRLIIKQMLVTPMEYNFWWLFSLKDKGFRAGMLIEEKKWGKNRYADSIMEYSVLGAIKPRCDSRTGRPRLKEVEKAFKDAHYAGYPLYKRGRNNDGELCWVNTIGKRQSYIVQLKKKSCKSGV